MAIEAESDSTESETVVRSRQAEDASIAEPPDSRQRSPAAPPWLRIAGALLVLVTLAIVGRQAGGYVPQFATWVRGLGLWGPVVFVTGYVLATIAFVPGSLLTLAAGAIFGIGNGVMLVFVAATLGATGAFLASRYAARAVIERRLAGNRRFEAIDRAVGEQGFKIVLLLRLSPAFPFNLLNYALGLTNVRLRDYLLACVGMLPGSLLFVYYGKLAGDVAALAGGAPTRRDAAYWVVLLLGLAATVVVTAIVTRIARRALSREISDA